MLKLARYVSIACIALCSANVFAGAVISCPLIIHCVGSKCHLPAGFSHWKIYTPVVSSTGRFVFYQGVYTQYPGATTVTCRYGKGKGPYIILDNAHNYKPLFVKGAQWISRDENRLVCNAAFPKHCSFYAE